MLTLSINGVQTCHCKVHRATIYPGGYIETLQEKTSEVVELFQPNMMNISTGKRQDSQSSAIKRERISVDNHVCTADRRKERISECRTSICETSSAPNNNQEDWYFKAYSDISIHKEMIGDTVRTQAYRKAILRNYEKMYGKVVLDLGAGTGILSMFCVQAGAKKVYAVEASAMAEQAKMVISANRMEDKITVLHGKLEEIDLPEEVDVIVSEWMGYFLLYESMLPSVLLARDKWLKKDGIILPESASLHLAPFCDSEVYDENLTFWEEVKELYKVDMSAMKTFARKCMTNHVHVRSVASQDIMAREQRVCHIDIKTVTSEQLNNVKSQMNFKCFGCSKIHGFVGWFSVHFPMDVEIHTSPDHQDTHWQQTILYLDDPVDVEQDTEIDVQIEISQHSKNNRFLDIGLLYSVNHGQKIHKKYLMDGNIT